MIYADIQCHGDELLHLPVCNWLDSSEFRFHISIDTNLPGPTPELLRQLNNIQLSNVEISKSPPASWGGISIVKNIINALKRSLEYSDWEFFATLSGACFPLKPPTHIAKFLDYNLVNHNKLIYMHVTSGNPCNPRQRPILIPENHSQKILDSMRLGRVNISACKKICDLIKEESFNPIKNIAHRQCAQFLETSKNHFEIKPLDVNSKSQIYDLNMHYGLNFGRQWVVLHRKVVQWLIESNTASTVSMLLSKTFIPDEFFFQKCLSGPSSPFLDNISKSCWANGGGGSKKLNEIDLVNFNKHEDIMFARKLSPSSIKYINHCAS